MIVKKANGFHVMSEDGKKKLGGPFQDMKQATDRLAQVEYFKKKKKKKKKNPLDDQEPDMADPMEMGEGENEMPMKKKK